jgi:Flp pilus assembly protein TadD
MSRSDDQAMRPTQDLDAVALVEQGKWQEAANAFRQALAKNPRDAGAWSHLAVAEWALGRLAEADEAYANSLVIPRQPRGADELRSPLGRAPAARAVP